jgi:hypothetical protein
MSLLTRAYTARRQEILTFSKQAFAPLYKESHIGQMIQGDEARLNVMGRGRLDFYREAEFST